jgi:hypothetical protein
MDKELAIKIASQYEDVKNTSDLMKKSNEIYLSNSKDSLTPFSQSEIAFATFVDYVKETCSEKEKDLIVISEFLSKVHKMLHISIQTLNEPVSEFDKESIKVLNKSLSNLKLNHLITDGLNKKTLKILDKICSEKDEKILEVKETTKKKVKIK